MKTPNLFYLFRWTYRKHHSMMNSSSVMCVVDSFKHRGFYLEVYLKLAISVVLSEFLGTTVLMWQPLGASQNFERKNGKNDQKKSTDCTL